jgi:hypothetical protein
MYIFIWVSDRMIIFTAKKCACICSYRVCMYIFIWLSARTVFLKNTSEHKYFLFYFVFFG